MELSTRKIISGYTQPDGSFIYMPDNYISRAEMMKLIAAALELPLEENFNGSQFADWDSVVDWAKPFVGALVKAGVVEGSLEDGKTYIHAGDNISREEMIAMAVRALYITVPTGSGAPDIEIADFESTSEWARDFVGFSLNNNMINSDDGQVRPLEYAKRSEAAMMLFKMIEYNNNL